MRVRIAARRVLHALRKKFARMNGTISPTKNVLHNGVIYNACAIQSFQLPVGERVIRATENRKFVGSNCDSPR